MLSLWTDGGQPIGSLCALAEVDQVPVDQLAVDADRRPDHLAQERLALRDDAPRPSSRRMALASLGLRR
jgi:hypothetical protein